MKTNKSLGLIISIFAIIYFIFNYTYILKINGENIKQNYIRQNIKITNAWARTANINCNSAIYLDIINDNDHDIIINKAEIAELNSEVELHQSFVDENGISRMIALDKISVPAKSTINLKPGSIHIMVLGLDRDLVKGQIMNLILYSNDGLVIKSTFIVN